MCAVRHMLQEAVTTRAAKGYTFGQIMINICQRLLANATDSRSLISWVPCPWHNNLSDARKHAIPPHG